LASNSLLEGLVFGRRAGETVAAERSELRDAAPNGFTPRELPGSVLHVGDMTNSIRSLMWRAAGIMRNEASLRNALTRLESWDDYVSQVDFRDARGFELVNLLTVGLLVVEAALWRCESRGTHFPHGLPGKGRRAFPRPFRTTVGTNHSCATDLRVTPPRTTPPTAAERRASIRCRPRLPRRTDRNGSA
jgi:L-aspartate oxidase